MPVSIQTDRLDEVLSGAWFSPPPASATARPSLHATSVGVPQSIASTGANLALWFKLRAFSTMRGFLDSRSRTGLFSQHSLSASC